MMMSLPIDRRAVLTRTAVEGCVRADAPDGILDIDGGVVAAVGDPHFSGDTVGRAAPTVSLVQGGLWFVVLARRAGVSVVEAVVVVAGGAVLLG
jgi:hypothetical protein